MAETPISENSFKNISNVWIAEEPGKYSPILVQEFYAAHQKVLFDLWNLSWKVDDPLHILMIWGSKVSISAQNISWFLHGADDVPNTRY